MSTNIFTSYNPSGDGAGPIWGSVSSTGILSKHTNATDDDFPSTLIIPPPNYSGTAINAIADSAFDGNSTIIYVHINVKFIGKQAFKNCQNIKCIEIGANVNWIGKEAFYTTTAGGGDSKECIVFSDTMSDIDFSSSGVNIADETGSAFDTKFGTVTQCSSVTQYTDIARKFLYLSDRCFASDSGIGLKADLKIPDAEKGVQFQSDCFESIGNKSSASDLKPNVIYPYTYMGKFYREGTGDNEFYERILTTASDHTNVPSREVFRRVYNGNQTGSSGNWTIMDPYDNEKKDRSSAIGTVSGSYYPFGTFNNCKITDFTWRTNPNQDGNGDSYGNVNMGYNWPALADDTVSSAISKDNPTDIRSTDEWTSKTDNWHKPIVINESFLKNCYYINRISLPNIVYIVKNAFASDTSTTTFDNHVIRERLTLPNNVEALGKEAFQYRSFFKGITLNNNLKLIYNDCFKNTYSLGHPGNTVSINTIFENKLVHFHIPNSVYKIFDNLFKTTNGHINSISLPKNDDFTSLPNYIFPTKIYDSIRIPSNISTINTNAFTNLDSSLSPKIYNFSSNNLSSYTGLSGRNLVIQSKYYTTTYPAFSSTNGVFASVSFSSASGASSGSGSGSGSGSFSGSGSGSFSGSGSGSFSGSGSGSFSGSGSGSFSGSGSGSFSGSGSGSGFGSGSGSGFGLMKRGSGGGSGTTNITSATFTLRKQGLISAFSNLTSYSSPTDMTGVSIDFILSAHVYVGGRWVPIVTDTDNYKTKYVNGTISYATMTPTQDIELTFPSSQAMHYTTDSGISDTNTTDYLPIMPTIEIKDVNDKWRALSFDPNTTTSTQKTCFYGFTDIMTKTGMKKIKNLKKHDLILTNDGYKPLTMLSVGLNYITKNSSNKLMVKIPKDFFKENVPNKDIYVTDTHPISVKIISPDNDKDFEFLHLFLKELIKLGLEYHDLPEEKYIYNLIFDKHYEIDIGNIKFLSHHPNHFNGNVILRSGDEINKKERSRKIYAMNNCSYFETTRLKDLLKNKPEHLTDKEYIGEIIQFN